MSAPTSPEFLKISPGLVTWSVYSKEVKTDLFGHAHLHQDNLVLIDPVMPHTTRIWDQIIQMGNPNLIILTNGNHARDSRRIARDFHMPIAASAASIPSLGFKPDIILDGNFQIQGLRSINCPGAGPGETALFSSKMNTLFLGDALINLPSTGLQFLPDKYCTDPKLNRKSLAMLLNFSYQNILMAHGIPLVGDARDKLRQLLRT